MSSALFEAEHCRPPLTSKLLIYGTIRGWILRTRSLTSSSEYVNNRVSIVQICRQIYKKLKKNRFGIFKCRVYYDESGKQMPANEKMNEYIKILVSKYVSGTLSDEEAVRLAKWIKMSGNNAELFRNAVRDMEKNRTTTSDAVEFWNRLAKDKFSANAGSKKTFRNSWAKYVGAIAAAFAVIVTVSILIMDIDKKDIQGQDIVAEQVQTQETAAPARKESLIYTAAAGEKKTVILPDNTKVMLNSGAKLMLSDDFNETERRVDLDGEAFFDVADRKSVV